MCGVSVALRLDSTFLAFIALLVSFAQAASDFDRVSHTHKLPTAALEDDSWHPVRRAARVQQPSLYSDVKKNSLERPLKFGPLDAMDSDVRPVISPTHADVVDIIGSGSGSPPHGTRGVVRTLGQTPVPVRHQKIRHGTNQLHANSAAPGLILAGDPDVPVYTSDPGATDDMGVTDGTITQSVDMNSGSQVISATGSLKVHSIDTWTGAPESGIVRMVTGGGALAVDGSPTDSRTMNFDIRQRLLVQDYVTLTLMTLVFVWTLYLSCSYVHKMSHDTSRALFYSDPSPMQPRLTCASNDLGDFMRAFGTAPAHVNLRIIGTRPQEQALSSLILQGHWGQLWRRIIDLGHRTLDGLDVDGMEHADTLFDVVLDLTPFVSGNGRLGSEEDGVELQKLLIGTSDPLDTFHLVKDVEWSCWEDVATNIRQRIRSLGFLGDVDVIFQSKESTIIYRNHPFANFVRNPVTQALIIFSVVGAFFFFPYVWFHRRKRVVRSYFSLHVDIQRYWELISDSLHPVLGFTSTQTISTTSPAGITSDI